MRLFPLAPALLLPLLLNACGGGSDGPPVVAPIATQTHALAWVDVQDGDGHTVMQHRYKAGDSADEDIVTTTQDPGYDGVWGTADDWRTAVTRCRYQGDAVPNSLSLGPASFFSVSSAACTWRRTPASTTVTMAGTYVTEELLGQLRPGQETDEGRQAIADLDLQPLLNTGDFVRVLQLLNSGVAVNGRFLIKTDSRGVTFCSDDCQPLGTQPSLPISCNFGCDSGLSAPVSDGISLDLGYCNADTVQIYDGVRAQPTRFFDKLNVVVYSDALTLPFCHVQSYEHRRYNSNNQLIGIDNYNSAGSDNTWLTADDELTSYTSVQTLTDGYLQRHYTGPGPDNVWHTADDNIGMTTQLQTGSDGRLLKARQCSAPGPDETWETADDVCAVLVFHYADGH